jgi:hypothetical protein
MEHRDESGDNEEEIEFLDTPDRLEYPCNLAKTKAVKLKLKCRHLKQELEKVMVGCVPKVIHFGNDDGIDDNSKDIAVIVAGIISGHIRGRKEI